MLLGNYTTELKCSICKKRCRTENGLQRHFESEHTNLRDSEGIKCDQCSKKFKTKSALDSHLESEHSSDAIAGGKGSKRASEVGNTDSKRSYRNSPWVDYETVIRPKKGSRNLQMYKCKLCDTHCFTLRSIQKHLARDHKQERHVPIDCQQCNRTFADEGALRRHITMRHRNGKIDSDNSRKSESNLNTSVKDVKSEDADSAVNGGNALANSKGSDEEKFHCESCSLNFSTVAKMCKHLRESHSQRQMQAFLQIIRGYRKFRIYSSKSGDCKYGFKCVNCKKRANSQKVIIEHINKEHNLGTEVTRGCSFNPSWSKSSKLGETYIRNAPPSGWDSKAMGGKSTSKDSDVPVEEGGISNEASNEAGDGKNLVRRKKGCKRHRFTRKKWKSNKSAKDPCHCLECGVVLKTEWALEEHYKTQHSGPNFQVVPKFSAVKGKYNLFLKCLICGKICRSKGNLKQHLKDHGRAGMKVNLMPNSLAVIDNGDGNHGRKDGLAKSKGQKRRRNVSCIYHCRGCGESFPRLFNYSEHECLPKGSNGKEKKVEGNTGDDTTEANSSLDAPVESKRVRLDSESKIDQQGEKNSKNSNEATGGGSVVRNKRGGLFKEKSGKQVRRQVILNRSPWKVNAQNESPSDSEKKGSKVAEMRENDSRFYCRFCKRPFSNKKELIRHEQLHSEANLFRCSNCGMTFTVMHKLRHHSMRCMQSKELSVGVDAPSRLENLGSFNGRVDGNTYPSYARKSEYTYFDPANRPFEIGYQYTDPCLDEELNTAEAARDSSRNTNSSLDNIVIADVRSCNPAFSNEKTSIDAGCKELVPCTGTPVRGRNVVASGELVPGYYLDGIQIPYVPIDGISPQNGTLNMPQAGCFMQGPSPHGMYTQGTVVLVPYFVPSQEMSAKDGRTFVAPKSGSLPPGGFLMNPNEFNGRFNASSEQRLCPAANDKSDRLCPALDNSQASSGDKSPDTSYVYDGKNALILKEKIEKLNKDGSRSRGNYQCGVCNMSFVTFGNYIKHREVHRR